MRDAIRVWQRQRLEDAERLEAIRARIRRSIDDPRPSMTEKRADAHFKALFAKIAKVRRNAPA
jgi:antitoxin ParD1/3/4